MVKLPMATVESDRKPHLASNHSTLECEMYPPPAAQRRHSPGVASVITCPTLSIFVISRHSAKEPGGGGQEGL
jgi:hypothetical protein